MREGGRGTPEPLILMILRGNGGGTVVANRSLTLYNLTSVCIFSILIISSILITFMFDSGMVLLGEIRC